ncbi:hypothetical protein HHI36_017210 [Cryptolaemus montrouzieri]|uniref:Uncharacterized protein n=1 Tax=Cryptolaemus montrouzieri TaxID=559131 RepID=A0ABD2NMA2_9CUCU
MLLFQEKLRKPQVPYRNALKNTKTDSIAKTNAETDNKENFKWYEVKETKRNITIGSIKILRMYVLKVRQNKFFIQVLHLCKVSLNTSLKEAAYEYLCKTFSIKDFDVEPCPMRDDAKSMSFNIAGDIPLLEDIYKKENWPAGCKEKDTLMNSDDMWFQLADATFIQVRQNRITEGTYFLSV